MVDAGLRAAAVEQAPELAESAGIRDDDRCSSMVSRAKMMSMIFLANFGRRLGGCPACVAIVIDDLLAQDRSRRETAALAPKMAVTPSSWTRPRGAISSTLAAPKQCARTTLPA